MLQKQNKMHDDDEKEHTNQTKQDHWRFQHCKCVGFHLFGGNI